MLERNSLLSCNPWMSGLLILFHCSKNSLKVNFLLYGTPMAHFRRLTGLSTRPWLIKPSTHTMPRKILFSSKLELSNKTIVENSALTDTNHAFQGLEYLDRRHKILQSFRGKLYNPERNDSAITKTIAEKIAGSGLAYEDLKRAPSCATSISPRVTRTGRILAAVVANFQCASSL